MAFFFLFVNEYCIRQGFGSAPAPWLHTRLDTKGVSKMIWAFSIQMVEVFLPSPGEIAESHMTKSHKGDIVRVCYVTKWHSHILHHQ